MNINEIRQKFESLYHRPPAVLVRAPGRVNLLGEHVDYNDGFVLPAAIDREVRIAAAPTQDDVVSLHALDLKQSAAFRLADVAQKVDTAGKPLPSWAMYPAGVAWALAEAGLATGGL